MDARTELTIAYAAYIGWLVFGLWDFLLHRRSDLPTTSGVKESGLHGVQIVVVGTGVLIWAALSPTWTLAVAMFCLAVIHACSGYLDTVVADRTRRIVPLEQHVHSVLDLAPWGFVGWVAWNAQPAWRLEWSPAAPLVWSMLIAPTVPTVLLPWILEFRASVMARKGA